MVVVGEAGLCYLPIDREAIKSSFLFPHPSLGAIVAKTGA